MIELLQAAALGIVQGLTEFLPVSSSGHLILVRALLGWQLLADTHLNKVFDVALHAGTFLALVVYFRSDLLWLLRGLLATSRAALKTEANCRLAWLIIIGTVPGAVAGLLFEDIVENVLGSPMLVAAQLILFAAILYAADRWSRRERAVEQAGWWDGILVGAAQALALAPGVSRSGITITTGLALGMKREAAARFSFLLSIPIVGGTALYSLARLLKDQVVMPVGSTGMFAVGILSATLSGYLCIKYFLGYLQKGSLTPFVIYRIALGAGLLGYCGSLR